MNRDEKPVRHDLETLEALARHGLTLFPCRPVEKSPKYGKGAEPWGSSAPSQYRTDQALAREELLGWWPGQVGLVVVDVDVTKTAPEHQRKYEATERRAYAESVLGKPLFAYGTPSGGWHLAYRATALTAADTKNRDWFGPEGKAAGKWGEIRGSNGYCCLYDGAGGLRTGLDAVQSADELHPNTWRAFLSPAPSPDAGAGALPSALAELGGHDPLGEIHAAPDGSRNDTIARAAARAGRMGFHTVDEVVAAARARCPDEADKAEKTARSQYAWGENEAAKAAGGGGHSDGPSAKTTGGDTSSTGPKDAPDEKTADTSSSSQQGDENKPPPRTDNVGPALSVDRFARDFADRHGKTFRVDPRRAGAQSWVEYRDGVWTALDSRPIAKVRQIVSGYCDAAKKPQQAHSSWSRAATYGGVLTVAGEGMRRPVSEAPEDQWDPNPHLLGLPGGWVANLVTGEVRDAVPEDYITRIAGAVPAESAGDWPKYLNQWCAGDAEMVAWLGAMAADCATGEAGDDLLVCLEGKPGSGKTTFLGAIQAALGAYANSVNPAHLLDRAFDEHPAWLARLDGARMVASAEPPGGKAWNAPLVSWLSGGDMLEARFMRRDPFTFQPRFRFVLACNQVPPLPPEGQQAGLERRIRIVPFEWSGGEDGEADEKVRRHFHHTPEGRGQVLRWILDSAKEFHEADANARYPWCERIKKNTNVYLGRRDYFGKWMTDCVERDPERVMSVAEAFRSLREWYAAQGVKCPSKVAVGRELKRRLAPAQQKRRTGGDSRDRVWPGFRVHCSPIRDRRA